MTAYVLFRSPQAAMRAEAVLRREGLAVRLVPAPRHLSAECGTALSFDAPDGLSSRVEASLRKAGVPFVGIHLLDDAPETAEERDERERGDSADGPRLLRGLSSQDGS